MKTFLRKHKTAVLMVIATAFTVCFGPLLFVGCEDEPQPQVRAGTVTKPSGPEADRDSTGRFETKIYQMPGSAPADALYAEIGKAITEAYNRGLNHGRNLIVQLAAGEMKISDFDRPHRNCRDCSTPLPTGNNVCTNCHLDNEDK